MAEKWTNLLGWPNKLFIQRYTLPTIGKLKFLLYIIGRFDLDMYSLEPVVEEMILLKEEHRNSKHAVATLEFDLYFSVSLGSKLN